MVVGFPINQGSSVWSSFRMQFCLFGLDRRNNIFDPQAYQGVY
jgi:hypothetical protein